MNGMEWSWVKLSTIMCRLILINRTLIFTHLRLCITIILVGIIYQKHLCLYQWLYVMHINDALTWVFMTMII